MQSYENKLEEQGLVKRFLLMVLDLLRRRIEDNALTLEEMESIARMVEQNLVLYGTADDFARLFGRSKDCVKVHICRKYPSSPIRKILYSFRHVWKIIPDSWKLHTNV